MSYAKPAFGWAPAVLRYLGRYTHRVAISNHRLLAFDGTHVTFAYKDYARNQRDRTSTSGGPPRATASGGTGAARAPSVAQSRPGTLEDF